MPHMGSACWLATCYARARPLTDLARSVTRDGLMAFPLPRRAAAARNASDVSPRREREPASTERLPGPYHGPHEVRNAAPAQDMLALTSRSGRAERLRPVARGREGAGAV